MKFTAAMAMPTPKSTPARTRFEPPSPNAKVNPDTTIATRERPRAIVLVNAVIKTLTAFSQGELPVACAKAGAARSRPTATARACRETALSRIAFCQIVLMFLILLCFRPCPAITQESSRVLPGCQWHARHEGEEPLCWFPVPCMVSRHTWSTRSYQRVSTFASGSSSVSVMRRLAAHGFGSCPPGLRGKTSENSPHLQGGFKKGKSEKE